MCKVMMIAGIKEKNLANTQKFIGVMSKLMSTSNTDGIGYAAMTREGTIFGERWLNNHQAWMDKIPPSKAHVRAAKKFPGLIASAEETIVTEKNAFGTKDVKNMSSIIMHTRMATSAKGMQNTHPFVPEDNSVALIHNGVISNHKEFDLKLSTCDSESILIAYLNHAVQNDIEAVQDMADDLSGYYACGMLVAETKTLDIFKNDTARLHYAYIKELDNFVFTTSDTDIKDACEKLNFEYETIFPFKADTILRLNAVDGSFVAVNEFKSDNNRYYNGYNGGYNYNNYDHNKGGKKHSWQGAKEYNAGTKALNPPSKEMSEFLKTEATITKLRGEEFQEAVFSMWGEA